MNINSEIRFQNRQHAGRLLAKNLNSYKNSDAIVLGVGPGGATVAFALANQLNLTCELVLCRKIDHPANRHKTIGSISSDQIYVHDSRDIPQEILAHQISTLQHEIEEDNKYLFGDMKTHSVYNKIVILVCDLLDTIDKVMAILKSLKAQKAIRLILAVPVITSDAANDTLDEVSELIFLKREPAAMDADKFFVEFPRVNLKDARQLVTAHL
jgi:putative phosphoribosyl transferase